MSKKLTTEEFIARARLKHGDKYDYSLVEYTLSQNKVKIICHDHGEFEQLAYMHLQGSGCNECGWVVTRDKLKRRLIDECIVKYDGYFDYSLVNHTNSKRKVEIICPIHGVIHMSLDSHYKRGCVKCNRPGLDEFIQQSNDIHDSNYDYSLVDYIDASTKVSIICKEHGVFKQRPFSHKRGQGCPSCAKSGFDIHKQSMFYVNEIWMNEQIVAYKFGVSNNIDDTRIASQNRNSSEYIKVIPYVKKICDGSVAYAIESHVLDTFDTGFMSKDIFRDGYTETISADCSEFLEYVDEIINTNIDEH